MSGNPPGSAVLNHRRIAVIEGVLGCAAVLAAAFFISQDAMLSAMFLAGSALILLGVGWRTWQLAATVAGLDARIDRKQSPLAYLTSRDSSRFGWTKQALVLCVSEHQLYVFRATVAAKEPESRIAYGDLMSFDLGSGTTKALLQVALPTRTYSLGGLIWEEVENVERVLRDKRPDLVNHEPIAARLEAMLSD